MGRLLTYTFQDGHIWRWSNVGVMKPRFEAFHTDRDEAQRILDQHTDTAKTADYFQRRAVELRDEMAEAIRQYDEYYSNPETPASYGMGKEQENVECFQEGRTQEGQAAA